MLRLLVPLVCLSLGGCYYMQAASGQFEVLRKREPIDEVIADPDTDPQLAARLALLDEARDFSISELGLPDNRSYRTYADLERDYVVWNIFAAPEFSLRPKTWCFPVAGCVAYRGYFKRESADREADRLREQGYDVAVGGVSAYSTLGKFSDPVLSTMMSRDDIELVGLLFHELAHQVIYVKGDSAFNESFATAVEDFGVKRWLTIKGRAEEFEAYVSEREEQRAALELVVKARGDLESIYDSDLDDGQKRSAKRARLQQLSDDVAASLGNEDSEDRGWLSVDMNNAHLVPLALYEGRLPEFQKLLSDCNDNIRCFYDAARALARESPGG